MGLLELAEKYSDTLLEAACKRLYPIHPHPVTRVLKTSLNWFCKTGIRSFSLNPRPHIKHTASQEVPITIEVKHI